MPDYSLTTATIRGLGFGRGTVRKIDPEDGINGWLSLPGYTMETGPRYGDHGAANAPVRHLGRQVTITGFVQDAVDRDAVAEEFLTALAPALDPLLEEELTISVGGRTLSTFGKIVARDVMLSRRWGSGSFRWKFQVDCSTPYRLGPPERQVFQLGQEGAGLVPPLTPPITFPAGTGNGSGVVVNAGNAPANAVFEFTGAQTAPGVSNSSTGRTVRVSNLAMLDGDVMTIDTDASQIRYNGESRRADSSSDLLIDMRLQPGANAINAVSLPGATAGFLSVLYRATYW